MFSSAYTITNLKIWSSETNAVLSSHKNFLLHLGPVISNLNPFPFDLVSAISCLVFFELPLFRAVAGKKNMTEAMSVFRSDCC